MRPIDEFQVGSIREHMREVAQRRRFAAARFADDFDVPDFHAPEQLSDHGDQRQTVCTVSTEYARFDDGGLG
jgi:hypothetical protein